MSQRAFNNCIINGTTIAIKEMVTGSGIIDSIGYDEAWTILNHCIRNVRLSVYYKAQFKLYLDQSVLNTQLRVTDDDNFGGTHKFYLDTTLVEEFDGLVTAEYDSDGRLTGVSIRGESNA